MNILMINCVCGVGSTGRIVADIAKQAMEQGHKVKIACSYNEPVKGIKPENVIVIGTKADYYIHNILSRITDHEGQYSKKPTRKLIREIKAFSPDVVHIHTLHGHWINYELLFNYFAKTRTKLVWTLHDCWAFTGHCTHYHFNNCSQWKTGCKTCSELREYPACYGKGDVSHNYAKKKKLFTAIDTMEIVTPSKWLAGEVRQSFLGKYNVTPIYNGIDLEKFKPTESNFREKYKLQNKKIILGVANGWGAKKGLYDIIKLSGILSDDYHVVIVGVFASQMRELPDNITGIEPTNSIEELVKIYSAADVFVNTSYEETMGLVTLEALACGIPVVVYDQTAVPEIVDERSGIVVNAGDINAMKNAIYTVINAKSDYDGTITRSESFNKKGQYAKYIDLYHQITGL